MPGIDELRVHHVVLACRRLSCARVRSPWWTLISNDAWFSEAVFRSSLLRVGMGVPLNQPGEHAALNCCADRQAFARIHALMRLFAEQVADQGLDSRHACLSADQDHFVELLPP